MIQLGSSRLYFGSMEMSYAGRVVERPLHPLSRVGAVEVGGLALKHTSETGNALRAHGVLLVGL